MNCPDCQLINKCLYADKLQIGISKYIELLDQARSIKKLQQIFTKIYRILG